MATPLQNTLSRTLMNGNLTINGNISVNSTNIALGFQAGFTSQGTSGVAVGYNSGYNQQGANNTFLGYQAGYDGGVARTGASNTCIGSSTASVTLTAGNNNTCLGAGATINNASYYNSTAIGTGATATANRQIRLGTASETVSIPGYISANLGIGVSPSYTLDVAGSVRLGSAASDTVRLNTITPMYTTPTFTAGMIGFKISGTISTSSISAGSETQISTINLPIGVWIVNGSVQVNSSQTGQGTFYYITDPPSYSFLPMAGLARNSGQYYYNPIFITVYITAAKDLNMYYNPYATTSLGALSYFFAVRIA